MDVPEPWQFSHAKEKLLQRILEGEISETSDPENVYQSDPEFQQYSRRNFRTNLKNLIASVGKRLANAEFDDLALVHDQTFFPRANLTNGGYPFWDTSDAKRLLTSDIDNRLDEIMENEDLWRSRPEYMIFPLQIFSKHIHQERTSRTQSSYWHNREKKKERR
jgi:hypothetical protein